MSDKKPVVLLLSYAPMVRADDPRMAGLDLNDPKTPELITNYYDSLPDSMANGCIWIKEDNGAALPILIYPDARNIADHLVEWAEGKPEDYFHISLAEEGSSYVLLLMPELQRSVDRYRLQYKLKNKREMEESEFNIIFRPLHVFAPNAQTYPQVKQDVPKDKMKVGLLDIRSISPDMSYNPSDIIWIGPLRVGPPDSAKEWLEDNLKEDIKPMPVHMGSSVGEKPHIETFFPGDPKLKALADIIGGMPVLTKPVTVVVMDWADFQRDLASLPMADHERGQAMSIGHQPLGYAPQTQHLFTKYHVGESHLLMLMVRSAQFAQQQFTGYEEGQPSEEVKAAQSVYNALPKHAKVYVDKYADLLAYGPDSDVVKIIREWSDGLGAVLATRSANAQWRGYLKIVIESAENTLLFHKNNPNKAQFMAGYYRRLLGMSTRMYIDNADTNFKHLFDAPSE
jgi:hypothetical protein